MVFYRQNLKIELETIGTDKGIVHTVTVKSYNTLIMYAEQYYDGKMFFTFDRSYYSQTTRRHQGVALAIARFGAVNGLDLVTAHKYDKPPKSITQIEFLFGYVPVKAWESTLEQISNMKHVTRVI